MASAKTAASSASGSPSTATLGLLITGSAILVKYAMDHNLLPALPALGPPAKTKPFATFSEFYPHYLGEHAAAGTKYFHFVGTTLMALFVAAHPELLASFASAGVVGFALFPMLRHLESGALEMAAMLSVFLMVGKALTGSWRTAFTPMLIGYGFAWMGHFFVEHNKPATFIYPLYSLIGDFRMYYDFFPFFRV